MIVDDNEINRLLLMTTILKWSAQIIPICCSSGEEALRYIKQMDFDIGLIDILMPNMDGFELAKNIKKINIVVNGEGASAMACTNLFKKSGVPNKNIKMIDRKGVIYRGRDNLNQWKSAHAIETKKRTLDEAIDGADVFLGLSSKSILSNCFSPSCY